MTNEPITRTLRLKRPRPARMLDGTYEVTSYGSRLHGPIKLQTVTIIVKDGVAHDHQMNILDIATQGWLRDHHIPTIPTTI